MSGMNPTIEWCEKLGGNCLRFTFGEMLTERDAEFAIDKWKQAFHQKHDQCISLIWDCTDMKQFESAARKKWTKALFEMRPQIGSIWLISDSTIIRLGVSVMGIATSLHIKAIRSEREVTH